MEYGVCEVRRCCVGGKAYRTLDGKVGGLVVEGGVHVSTSEGGEIWVWNLELEVHACAKQKGNLNNALASR